MTNTPKIVVYRTRTCPYCVAAARFLREVKGQEVEEIDLTFDDEGRIELQQRTGMRTVPQIFIGEVHVGGYDEMRALDAQGELDTLLGL
jgi:glutaredoxin 3